MTLLKKESGGTSLVWEGVRYEWPADDPVCDVPPGFAHRLLSIQGAGFREVPPGPVQSGPESGTEGGTETPAKTPAAKPAAKTA
jgi:hypothetical protein